jgi:tripartite motif-containing protein 71
MVEAVVVAKHFALISVGLICLSFSPFAATAEPLPQFLTMWGTYGPGPGQLINPWGIAVDAAGYVYVADQGNDRVCKFTAAGQFVLSWGLHGAGPGQFNNPSGIAVDPLGRILVGDLLNDRIEVFSSEGTFLNAFGSSGHGAGQLTRPYDVAVSPSGMVYVANHGNHRVEEYDANGTFLDTLGSADLGVPTGVGVDAVGNVYVSDEDSFNDFVAKFDAAGNLLLTVGGPGYLVPGFFSGPAGIDIDPAGNIYVADHGNSTVQKFGPNGALLSYWVPYSQFRFPLDVAVGPDGSIYVSDTQNHRVQKFGYGPTPVQTVTWGSMKARYRAGAVAEPASNGR